MNKKIREYVWKTKNIYLPYLAEKCDIPIGDVSKIIADMWSLLPSPIIYNNMLIIDYQGEIPRYYEICDTKYQRGKTLDASYLDKYVYYNNKKEDQHVSVFRHDSKWLNHFKETGNVRCVDSLVMPDWIYLELDRDTVEEASIDTVKIYNNFDYAQAMRFYHSGNRSIHIGVDAKLFGSPVGDSKSVCGHGRMFYNLAHRIAGDVRHGNGVLTPHLLNGNELQDIYVETFGETPEVDINKIKQLLENIDPNIFNRNSLIRQPNSIHEKTGKPKVELSIYQVAELGGVDKKDVKKLDNREIKPYLMDWVVTAYDDSRKRKTVHKNYYLGEDKTLQIFSMIDGFDPDDANEDGWVSGLFSPFYEDTNPSVSVNIKTGWYMDFGNQSDSMNVVGFYARMKNLTLFEAKKELEK